MISQVPQSLQAKMWILDIDGTLMPSHEIDNQCYWQAVDECFGGAPAPVELHGFRHVSDAGILSEWMARTWHRDATAGELEQVRGRFLALTQQAFARNPAHFAPMPGLKEWLATLIVSGNPSIAIATGGWAHTARFKLQASGLDSFGFPLASCDDAIERQAIMKKALALLKPGTARNGKDPRDSAVCYVGDGPWDCKASQSLGWDFIGIAEGPRAAALREAGAKRVFCNFNELLASKPVPATVTETQGHVPA
jgi:phosphoglycolate phosphatase-like HAD superfamily hydrolase